MKNNCIVVIPVYKVNPSKSEKASFYQCLSVLKNHDICIFTYRECDLSWYCNTAKELSKNIIISFFDKKYFCSVEGYNNLCFSTEFYKRFNEYEYMLIYQLDAWVFRDELLYWCEKNYDYIGAPIFYAYNNKNYTRKILGIGNGGFCLRRISYCLDILNSNKNKPFLKPMPLINLYWNYFLYSEKFKRLKNRLRIIPTVISKIFGRYNTLNYYIKNHLNEDMIFGTWFQKSWGGHSVLPTEKEAMKFSFEVHPEYLYQNNDEQLPFGCHAFMKWDYDTFWYRFIKI